MNQEQSINIVKELVNRKISVNEQINLFKKITGKKRRMFFVYKKFLLTGEMYQNWDKTYNYYKVKKEKKCYFCSNIKNLNVHHLQYEPEEKIIVLCRSCHNKLHNLEKECIRLV